MKGKRTVKNFMRTFMTGLMTGCVAFLMIPCMSANAAQESYTVTFRPGNVGSFAVTGTEQSGKKEMALETAELLYGGNADVTDIQATDNGSIKLTVNKGAEIPAAPGAGYVKTEEGYFTRNVSEWGPEAGETVIKNVDYVVDYGKLTDGVEYTVRYVDAASDASIAPVAVAYGNIGDTVEINAPANLTLSEAAHYTLTSQAVQSMVLSKDSAANVLTFSYTAQPGGIIINEITEYEEGDVVVLTETVIVPGQQTDAGAVLAQGQGEEQQDNQEIVNIEDDQTPLADQVPQENTDNTDNTGNDIEEVVQIEDEEAALSAFPLGNTIYIASGVSIALLMAVSVIWLKKIRQVQDENEE